MPPIFMLCPIYVISEKRQKLSWDCMHGTGLSRRSMAESIPGPEKSHMGIGLRLPAGEQQPVEDLVEGGPSTLAP